MKIWRFTIGKDKLGKIGLWYHHTKNHKNGMISTIAKRIYLLHK